MRVGITDTLAISNTVNATFIIREITKKMLIENQIGRTNLFKKENTISKLSSNKNLCGSFFEYKKQNKTKQNKTQCIGCIKKAHLVRDVEASGLKAKMRENQTGATFIEK